MPEQPSDRTPPQLRLVADAQSAMYRTRHPSERLLEELPPPEWLSPTQQALWHGILARAPRGVLLAIDRELVTVYVEVHDRYVRAAQAQRELDPARDKEAIAIYTRIMRQCTQLCRMLAAELGFAPIHLVTSRDQRR